MCNAERALCAVHLCLLKAFSMSYAGFEAFKYRTAVQFLVRVEEAFACLFD